MILLLGNQTFVGEFFMVFDNRNYYPIQRKQPIEMTPECKFVYGVIDGLVNVILSRGLQFVVEKLSNLYSE